MSEGQKNVGVGLSLGVSPREPMARFLEVAAYAEELGVEMLWLIDSQLAMKDCSTALALCAANTTRVKFGPGVMNPLTRELTVIANQMATLAEVSGGRAVLGMGSGDSSIKPLGIKPVKLAELRAAIVQLRTLLAGGTVERAGGEVTLPFAPAAPPPVYLAATKPRALALAGAVADGVIVLSPADPDVVRDSVARVREGAREAGRNPAEVTVDLWVPIAVDDDPNKAVDDLRGWTAAQVRFWAEDPTLPPSLAAFRAEMQAATAAYEYGHHLSRSAPHGGTVSAELVKAVTVAGTAADCIAKLAKLVEVSQPDRLTFTLLSGGRERRLGQLMTEVIPALRSQIR